jgi:hypothetical protein
MRSSSALAAAICLWSAGHALADDMPATLQARLLSNALGYVRNLAAQSSGPTKVAILSQGPGDSPSREARALAAALKNDTGALSSVFISFREGPELAKALTDAGPTVVYLAPDLDEQAIRAALEACSHLHVLTTTGQSTHVRWGVVMGFIIQEGSPKILINLAQAKKQNLDISSKLLALAVIVD